MSDNVKIALIASVALLIAVGAWIYFSPFQTCVRATTGAPTYAGDNSVFDRASAQRICAHGRD